MVKVEEDVGVFGILGIQLEFYFIAEISLCWGDLQCLLNQKKGGHVRFLPWGREGRGSVQASKPLPPIAQSNRTPPHGRELIVFPKSKSS